MIKQNVKEITFPLVNMRCQCAYFVSIDVNCFLFPQTFVRLFVFRLKTMIILFAVGF